MKSEKIKIYSKYKIEIITTLELIIIPAFLIVSFFGIDINKEIIEGRIINNMRMIKSGVNTYTSCCTFKNKSRIIISMQL
jgi:hypothetical protein